MTGFQKSGPQPCFYCGHLAEGYDHMVARSCGGLDVAENLVPACLRCNSRKRELSVEEFRLYIGLMDRRIPVVFYGESVQPQQRDWLYVATRRAALFAHNRAAL
jgi:hypothetical protein